LKNTFDKFLNIYLIFLLVFLSHRFLSFFYLNRDTGLSVSSYLDSLVVGFMSDIWIAFLAALIGALVFGLISLIFNQFRWFVSLRSAWLFIWVAFVVVCTSLHQGYVEFFKVQVLPIHLKYFLDRHFLEANASSAINFRAIAVLAVGLVAGQLLLKASLIRRPVRAYQVFFGILALSLAAHVVNIRWRVQHFIQDNLQVNFYEKLYLNSKISKEPKHLSSEEFEFLTKRLNLPLAENYDRKTAEKTLLSWHSNSSEVSPVAEDIKKKISQIIAAEEKPIILTVLLESARPSDFGAYHAGPDDAVSLTPVFDGLSKEGVFFENAFSTSSVTRGGQEAVWCGYYSSMNNSMMRERQDIKVDCLPRLLGDEGEFFWIHGGRGEFDQQETFWRSQGIPSISTQQDFSTEVPKTGWGVSDIALSELALKKIDSLDQESTKKFLMGMVLSMTNHIPWDLPEDAKPSALFKSLEEAHLSYQTTHYTDQAIAVLVDGLKEKRLWNRTVLLILSDHGAAVPPYQELYQGQENLAEKLRSHIVMLLSGGVVESATKGRRELVQDFVSQAGVAGFLDFLVQGGHSFFAPSIFHQGITPMVLADLEGEVFLPRYDLKLRRQEVLVGDIRKHPEGVRQEVYYYRVFLEYMNYFVNRP